MFKKFLLIVEVISLFIIGALFAIKVGEWIKIEDWLLESNNIVLKEKVDFIGLSTRSAVSSFIKYGCIFLIVATFLSVTKSGYTFKSVGVSLNGKSTKYILRASVIIFCIGGIIPKFLFFLWPTGLIGDGPENWKLLNQSWGLGFWIFMLVGSVILPPILEELFFRGYAQSRLENKFSSGFAIASVALIFTIFHTQYIEASPISILMMISILFSSLVLGYSRYHTGTIIPGVIAHALGNIPVIGVSALIVLVLMIIILFVNRNILSKHIYIFLSLMNFKKAP